MNKKTIGIVIAAVAGAAVVAAGGIGISKYVSHQKTEHRIHKFEPSINSDKSVNVVRYPVKDKKINDLAKQWKDTYGTPVRAIRWHHRLCWLHVIILFLFHERNYNELIRNFPTETACLLINRGNLPSKDTACLKFMIYLSEVFNILMGNDPNVLAECVDLNRTELEKKLVDELANIFPSNPNVKFGSPSDINLLDIQYILDVVFKNIYKHDINFLEDWAQSYRKVINFSALTYGGIHGNYNILTEYSPDHVYVSLSMGKEKLTLGENWSRSGTDPETTIMLKSSHRAEYEDNIRPRYNREDSRSMFKDSVARFIREDRCDLAVLGRMINKAREELAEAKKHGCSDEDCNPLIDAICNVIRYTNLGPIEMRNDTTNQKLENREVAKLAKNVFDEMGKLIEKGGLNRKGEN